ncbi:hypothetical protein GCM10009841_07280 [Microlunatus panaciterrae]
MQILGGVVAMMLGGTVLAAPVAAAAAPTVIKNTVQELSCVFDTLEGGTVYFFAGASSMDQSSGSGMFVEDETGVPFSGEGGTATFGSSFTGTVTMRDVDTGQAVGEVSVVASLERGEPRTDNIRERSGNSWTTGSTVTTDYTVLAQTVTVPGYTVLPEANDCSGSEIIFDVRTTNPAAQVYGDTEFESAICALEGLPYGEVRLTGSVQEPFFEVVIDDQVNPLKASGEVLMQGHRGSGSAPLSSLVTGDQVAVLNLTLDLQRAGRRQAESVAEPGWKERVSWVPYHASVDVTTSDGRAGRAKCDAEQVTTKIIIGPHAAQQQ